MEFEGWIAEVDKVLEKHVGLGHMDMPDWHWMDSFEDGVTPKEAAEYMLEDEGFEV